MLKKHLNGLLADFRYWITNAAARGFRNFDHRRIRILFFCGRLDLRPKTAH